MHMEDDHVHAQNEQYLFNFELHFVKKYIRVLSSVISGHFKKSSHTNAHILFGSVSYFSKSSCGSCVDCFTMSKLYGHLERPCGYMDIMICSPELHQILLLISQLISNLRNGAYSQELFLLAFHTGVLHSVLIRNTLGNRLILTLSRNFSSPYASTIAGSS